MTLLKQVSVSQTEKQKQTTFLLLSLICVIFYENSFAIAVLTKDYFL